MTITICSVRLSLIAIQSVWARGQECLSWIDGLNWIMDLDILRLVSEWGWIEISVGPRSGFVKAFSLVLRTQEDGMMVGGPPCGPWIFLNAGTHKRKLKNIWGNLESLYVKNSNTLHGIILFVWSLLSMWCFHWDWLMNCPFEITPRRIKWPRLVARWCLLLLLGMARCIYNLTEQPGGSLMRHYPYFRYLASVMTSLGCPWMETFLSYP